jgi:hypothetical protein
MDLNAIVSGAVGAVNPPTLVSIKISGGYTTNSDGSRTPTYPLSQSVYVSLQALQYNDIVMADSLNIQGVRQKMYVHGHVEGLVRAKNKGGDIVIFPDGSVWKIALVSEHWRDWTSCILTLQDNS